MTSNSSVVYDLPPLPTYTLAPREPVLPPIPDNILALILPIVAYWALSMFYHFLDVNDYFPQYRLHTPVELLKRNKVTRWEVVRDVVLQQVIQTLAGMAMSYFDEEEFTGKDEYNVAVWASRIRIVQKVLPRLLALFGFDASGIAKNVSRHGYRMLGGALAGGYYPGLTQSVVLDGVKATAPAFAGWEIATASFIYWYFIPGLQFAWAIGVLDTWQYFLHRAMHLNRWLYVTFHSRHHRLYVPYAFGALYNHPVEGFLLDTAGTGVGFLTSMMTNRQAMWYFTFSTIKTVDDHCGYAFPWDPLQHLTSNNAAYHDIHHQSWGIKNNFSQPFFIFWDRLMGTQWRGDTKLRYERGREAAQKKADVEADETSHTPVNLSGGERVTISTADTAESNARSRLRRKTASLSPHVDTLKGAKHGVRSVFQA